MPEYPFQSGKKIEYFFFSMQSVPSIGNEILIDGKKWKRVIIEPPRGQIDSISNINPDSADEFVRLTQNHKGTYGDLINLSQELSEKRIEKHGSDKIKQDWEKQKAKKLENRKAENKRKKSLKNIKKNE